MEEIRVGQLDTRQIRNVPIAVTPDGFWCCPSPAVLQKTVKQQSHQTKPRSSSPPPPNASSVHRAPTISSEKRTSSAPVRQRENADDQRCLPADNTVKASQRPQKSNTENSKQKISVGFGQLDTSDLKVILYGKDGLTARLSVHRSVLAENCSFFADKLSGESTVSCIELPECEDVEIYVETVGLMYCKDVKQRLIRLTVPYVLRILKVAEFLGYRECIVMCLNFLEAVPWIGEEEDEVVSSIKHLRFENYGVSPLLKRVCPNHSEPPNDTLGEILQLVLDSNEERGRREMKALVLKLIKESSASACGTLDVCVDTLYRSVQICLDSLLPLFRQAAEPYFIDEPMEFKEPIGRRISLDADNLLWLVEILLDRVAADEFAVMWASQTELAELHGKLPTMSRYLVSCITARLFVGIGRGELLPSKDTRQHLLELWLQPLIGDYNWLQHRCQSFDRKVVEEGIGRTILTLPLEDQQRILLSWLSVFLKAGDSCPNLQRAFEVWWRRTFVRPYSEHRQLMTEFGRKR